MLFDRNFITISKANEAVYTEKGSRFIGLAFPISNEAEAKRHLDELKHLYPDATHHCYVWILNPDKSSQRLNDDGEPSNTAARPILKQVNALNLTNILVVVVRYFGGKQLGIPGLISAYGMVAKLCLAKCDLVTKTLLDYYKLETSFENEHLIYNLARKHAATIIETLHLQNAIITLSINGANTELLLRDCKKLTNFEITFIKTDQ